MAISSSGIRAGAAYVELFLHDNKLVRGLARAQQRLRRFGRSAMDIGKRLMAVSGIMAAPFAYATRVFAGFDDAMRKTKAVTGATEAEFEQLTATAKRLGRTTSFTAAQVADAMAELGRAGFKPKQIDAAIGGILNLARATDTDLPRAAEIAGNALRGFGMDVSEIDRVVDVLSYTANNSSQVLDDLGESMKFVAPLAAEAGEPIESVAAALGVLANAGIKGSMAGTATARALKNLSREANQKKLAALGVQAVDAAGDLRPLGDILADLGERVKSLGSAKRLAIFEALFGRGQAAAMKLASDPNALSGLAEGLKKAGGYARKTAEEMDAGIGGTIRRLLSAAEGVFLSIGKAIEKPLVDAMESIRNVAETIANWIDKNREAVVVILKVILAVGALGAVLVTAGVLAMALNAVVTLFITTLSAAGTAIGILGSALAALATPIGATIAIVTALGATVLVATGVAGKAIDWLGEVFGHLKSDAEYAIGGIRDALMAGDITLAAKILWLTLKKWWAEGVGWLSNIWTEFKFTFQRVLTEAFYGAIAGLAIAWSTLQKGWAHTTAFLMKTWHRFIGGLKAAWSISQNWLAKRFIELQGLLDDSLDVKAAKRGLDRTMNRELAKIGMDVESAEQRIEADKRRRLEGIESEESGTLAEIARQADEAKQRQTDEFAAKLKKNQAEIDAAKEELRQAREAAAKKRAAAEAERPERPEAAEDKMAKLAEKLKGVGRAGVAAAGEATVRGTFNAAALQGLMAGNTQDRIAAASEETAKNTKKLVRKAQDGLAFA